MRRTIAAIATALLVSTSLFAQAPGRWITGTFAPLPAPEEEYTAVVSGDRLYLIGGNRGGRPEWPRHVVEYNLATNTWATKKPAPFSGDHMSAVALAGKAPAAGWLRGVGIVMRLSQRFDAGSNTSVVPTVRPATVAAPNIGGFLSSNTDVVEEYDPATNTWRAMTKMPTPRSGHGWTTHQGRIYVAGGEVRDHHMDAIFRDVEVFDPAVNDWYRLPGMPTARHGVNLAAYGNRLHAIGGHLAFAATGGTGLHTPANEVFEFAR